MDKLRTRGPGLPDAAGREARLAGAARILQALDELDGLARN